MRWPDYLQLQIFYLSMNNCFPTPIDVTFGLITISTRKQFTIIVYIYENTEFLIVARHIRRSTSIITISATAMTQHPVQAYPSWSVYCLENGTKMSYDNNMYTGVISQVATRIRMHFYIPRVFTCQNVSDFESIVTCRTGYGGRSVFGIRGPSDSEVYGNRLYVTREHRRSTATFVR